MSASAETLTEEAVRRSLVTSAPKPNGKLDPNAVFGLDSKLSDDGAWVTIDGYRFKVAQMNNPVHEAYLARMGETRLRSYQNSQMSVDEYRQVNGQLVAHSFLRDWDERFVEFSTERAVEFCVKNPHITRQIIAIADDYHNFLLRDREADVGN